MAAAALTKVLRGGRRLGSFSHPLLLPPRPGSGIGCRAPQDGGVGSYLLLPGIGRRTSLLGGVGPLPPRLGGTALSSPSAHAARLQQKVHFISTEHNVGPLPSLKELKKYYVWINGSFQRYDSKFIPLFILEMDDDLGFQLRSIWRYWMFPAMAFALISWILLRFIEEYYRHKELEKVIVLDKGMLEIEQEKELLMAQFLELKKQLALLKIKKGLP